ncbi:MAG: Holliday junction DNA helicase RuvA [Nitrospirae bacterium GWC2_46_6]|nr:MAG: Holliday junction DNA helicase RuvA [Nitrospirae bacterium GWA2_46_11]OGW23372.1 MAG: Holliday junction DNA helicase RuvA [Nitrospirae bacterium GWC2_46_6]OGW23921.1 MAG: Holliday junction DNA helicase RuvA [Nitrospirae bacterium GWB2_47_37]HAK89292.1 Holliday junction branch migration protein RuvA [Nitrospiraceae bacterium]HCL80930.1 Holliday junction branch migration protein RuvA [Nitrospiraceae bacterium]
MIASLRGRLISKKPDYLIVEVGGVGYHVNVPVTLLSDLPDEHKDVFLFVYTHVREDAIQLYGFQTDDDKRIFTTLLGISGIGPKVALNILSTISPDNFYNAINSEDVDMLCKAPGLGKKTAHRLILELRGKLPFLKEKKDTVYDDTLSALVNLGYKKNIAQEVLEKAYDGGRKDIESLLKEALKYLTKE